jgi:hypothetical protein
MEASMFGCVSCSNVPVTRCTMKICRRRFSNMKRASLVLLVILGLAPQAPVWSGAWGRVFAVEVRGNGLAEPLIITDSAVVQELSFWVGPGTGFSEFMGPVSLEHSIIAWDRGEATDRPNGLETYEVRFLLEPRHHPPAYVIRYEPDPANGSGYIYTPASSGRIVTHGIADTWMYASSRWNERVGAAISERLSAQP